MAYSVVWRACTVAQVGVLVVVAALCCVGLVGIMGLAAWATGRRKRGQADVEGQRLVIKPARLGSFSSRDMSPLSEVHPFGLRGEKQATLKVLSPISPQESKLVMEGALCHWSEGTSPIDESLRRERQQLEGASADASAAGEATPQGPLGTLDVTVNYDGAKSMLVVCIVRANDLPAKDAALGTSDPYVKLQLLPEKRHRVKTRVLRRTLNPQFDESFTFYGVTRDQLAHIGLHFVVLSFDRFSRDDIVGEVLCPLVNVDCLDKDAALHLDIQQRNLKASSCPLIPRLLDPRFLYT